jgi:hypothetical protein
MKYLSIEKLTSLGRWAMKQGAPSQEVIDRQVSSLI